MRLSRADRQELGVVEPFWQAQLAVLIALVTAANFTALGLLIHLLLERNTAAGRDLIIAAGQSG